MPFSKSKLKNLKKEEIIELLNKNTKKEDLIKLILDNDLIQEKNMVMDQDTLNKMRPFIGKTIKLRNYDENKQISKKWEANFNSDGVLIISSFDKNNEFVEKKEHLINSTEFNLLCKYGLSKGTSKIIKSNNF